MFPRKGPAPTPTCCAASGWHPSIHSSNAQGPESRTCPGDKSQKTCESFRWWILKCMNDFLSVFCHSRLFLNGPFGLFFQYERWFWWKSFDASIKHLAARTPDSSLQWLKWHLSTPSVSDKLILSDTIVPICTNIFWKQKLEQCKNTRGPTGVPSSFSHVPWSKDREYGFVWFCMILYGFVVIHSMLGILTMGINRIDGLITSPIHLCRSPKHKIAITMTRVQDLWWQTCLGWWLHSIPIITKWK